MEKSSSNANLLPAPSSLSAQKHQWTSNIRLNPINREHHPPFSVLWAPLPFISYDNTNNENARLTLICMTTIMYYI